MGPIKYTALKAKASPRQVAAWRESLERQVDHRESQDAAGFSLRASRWVGPAAVLAVAFGVVAVLAGLLRLFDRADTGLLTFAAVVATIAFGTLWVFLQRRVRTLAEGWRDPYRLMSFAKDNGFHAVPVAGPGELPGRIFGRGIEEHRVRLDVVAWVQGGRQCHVATECWDSGTPERGGQPQDSGSCRYLAVRIGAEELPHVEFDAVAEVRTDAAPDEHADAGAGELPGTEGRSAEQLPVALPHHASARLTTEGGTTRWAQSVFSERLLRLLTHSAQPRDAEIVDRWFIAYDLKDADPLSVSAWERTFQVVAALPAYPLAPPPEGGDLEPETVPVPADRASRTDRVKRMLRLPARAVTPVQS